MAISITKPTVGGSNGTWGTELNTALDTIVAGVNNAQTTADNATPAAGSSTGIPASTITTKGDLVVGTGNATVTRLGVGTNGYAPIADSTTTSGIAWKLAPGSIIAKIRQTGTQSLATATSVPISFNAIDYDRLGVTSSGMTSFVPGVIGWYEFTGGVSFAKSSLGTVRIAMFALAGNESYGSGGMVPPSNVVPDNPSCRPTVVYISSASQGVALWGYHNAGSTLSTDNSLPQYTCTMNVKWLGAS